MTEPGVSRGLADLIKLNVLAVPSCSRRIAILARRIADEAKRNRSGKEARERNTHPAQAVVTLEKEKDRSTDQDQMKQADEPCDGEYHLYSVKATRDGEIEVHSESARSSYRSGYQGEGDSNN